MTSSPHGQTSRDEDHTHTRRCFWDGREARWSCAPTTATPATATPTTGTPGSATTAAAAERAPVDVRDMLVVHTAMLREFRLAPAAVVAVAADDHRRVKVVASHVRFLTDLLHHHHEGEDRLLWPTLRERASTRAGALINEVEEQHSDLDAALDAVERCRAAWSVGPTPAARDALAHHLGHLHDRLADHLDLEERELLPLAAALLTQAEWDAVGEAGAAAVRRRDLPLLFGMFAQEGEPAVLAQMLSAAPRLARVVIPPVAARAYARRTRRVHGTPRP